MKIEQLQHATPDELEHIEGRERENLEGWIPALATDDEVREALEKAFDYRGDVTLTLKDGRTVEGYLYDRRSEPTLEASLVRIIPTPKPGVPVERMMVSYAEIAALNFKWARYGRGQDVRCVGEEVLGEEGRGRDRDSD